MRDARLIRILPIVLIVAVLSSSFAGAAGTKMITFNRCGYVHRILPGGPLDIKGTYAVYEWHVSCAATRQLLESRGSHLPDKQMDIPTAVVKVGGMRFICQSGDFGGGECVNPYGLRQSYPGGAYLVSGHPTRRVYYANCSFSGACSKTKRLPYR
jgi:hypothetical protein